ncbi:hypothetical protein P4V47_08805 [Brevibacillus laterosporus]|uniref:hypothetical protein n=1 Tax=Brevibacillus laterosporus TaxID=1465 RepID=UPI002E23B124|nr:hypothetical protein [Brevibacillus laterosporus]
MKFNRLYANNAETGLELERYENSQRSQYGKVQGHYRWDLAKVWFRTTNDNFFKIYGFNFVPRGKLHEEARGFVWTRANQ